MCACVGHIEMFYETKKKVVGGWGGEWPSVDKRKAICGGVEGGTIQFVCSHSGGARSEQLIHQDRFYRANMGAGGGAGGLGVAGGPCVAEKCSKSKFTSRAIAPGAAIRNHDKKEIALFSQLSI